VSDEIDALQRQVNEAHLAYLGALRRLGEAKQRRAGLAIGDIVYRKDEPYEVVHVDTGFSRPWVKGRPRNKDGSLSKRVVQLYGDWSKEPSP
jgi:hypothetical protein